MTSQKSVTLAFVRVTVKPIVWTAKNVTPVTAWRIVLRERVAAAMIALPTANVAGEHIAPTNAAMAFVVPRTKAV